MLLLSKDKTQFVSKEALFLPLFTVGIIMGPRMAV